MLILWSFEVSVHVQDPSVSNFLHMSCCVAKLYIIWNSSPLPLQCYVGPVRRFSLCPVFPAPPGPHMFLVPVSPAPLLLGSAQALNFQLESVHCCIFLALSLCPLLHHFCHLPLCIPVASQGPAPTESPQSPGLRSWGYSAGQRQELCGCPTSSDCPWRRQRRMWSCSWWAFRRCRERSPCWGRSSSEKKRGGRLGCGGSELGCQRSSGLTRCPGPQEQEAMHQVGSCNRLEGKSSKGRDSH